MNKFYKKECDKYRGLSYDDLTVPVVIRFSARSRTFSKQLVFKRLEALFLIDERFEEIQFLGLFKELRL